MPFLRREHQKRCPKLCAQIRVAAGFEIVRDVQRIATLDRVVQGLAQDSAGLRALSPGQAAEAPPDAQRQ